MLNLEKHKLIIQLRWLEKQMFHVSAQMKYYGGFDENALNRSRELLNASSIVEEWADTLENEIPDENRTN